MSHYLSGELEENNNDVMFQNIDYIYSVDHEFIEKDKTSGNYFLGSYYTLKHKNTGIEYQFLDMVISPHTFFRFPIRDIRFYMYEYSIDTGEIEIIKLYITNKNRSRLAILKTYWLRLIQRHWKKTFAARKTAALKRGMFSAQRAFETRGNYGGGGLNVLPSIYGMLSCYAAASPPP